MITIKSFDLFRNFINTRMDFQEEKAIIRMKSIKIEREFEFKYKDAAEISDSFTVNHSQGTFGFWLLVFSSFVLAAFNKYLHSNLAYLHIAQFFYICSLILYITSFKKSWYFFISDANSNTLAYIKQTHQNRNDIQQVIELIKNKSSNLDEISITDPFPSEPPVFEHISFDFSNLVKSTDRFYENEIIRFKKSMFEESVYKIKYNELSEKINHGKQTADYSGWTLTLATLVASIILGFYFGFNTRLDFSAFRYLLYIVYALYGLFLVSLPLSFIKREVIGIHDNNNNVKYWAYINRVDKENIERIIEFIRSKISTDEKE